MIPTTAATIPLAIGSLAARAAPPDEASMLELAPSLLFDEEGVEVAVDVAVDVVVLSPWETTVNSSDCARILFDETSLKLKT